MIRSSRARARCLAGRSLGYDARAVGVRHDDIGKRTILFLSANPIETDRISIDEEVREIQGGLERSRLRDRCEFVTRWATRAQDLIPLLRTLKPAVVHFSGHGGAIAAASPIPPSDAIRDVVAPEAAAGAAEFGIYLVGPDRQAHWVSGEAIARTLCATPSVHLVVLNACYSDALADALLSHVPCVVGMATAIKDDAARSFAAGFYRAIGDGTSVAAAFREGVNAINFDGLPDTDCPRLRSGAGVDPERIIIVPPNSDGQPDSDGQPIDDFPPPPNIWQRLGTTISTAFSDGHGAYLLAMLAFGAAATFLCRTLQAERQYHEALASLVTQEQEAYRGETHQVLAAGLLRSESWDICNDNEQLLEDTERAARRFTRELEAGLDHPESLRGSLQQCPGDPKLRRCPNATADLDPALTDDVATESTLMIPGPVAAMVQRDSTRWSVLIASRKIAGHGLLRHDYKQGTIDSEYFVDLSGALRIIPAWTENTLPAHRTFAGASYVYSTLSKSSRCAGGFRTVTRPYLDLVGMGMVKTLCYRITPKERVAGILCFDVAPPDPVVYQFLEAATRLFDLHVVQIYDHDRSTAYPVDSLPKNLTSLSWNEVADLAVEWGRPPNTEPAAGESAVRMLGDKHYFGTAIKRDPGADKDSAWTAVVFGRVRRSPTRDLISVAMTLLFAGIGSAAIVAGVRKKAKRLDVALIRGLQVGVLKLDDRDVIVGANDRAQEIFDVELPAFDTPKRRLARPLSSLIHGHIIELDSAGRLGAPVKVKDYGEIKKERDKGRSSSYYALVKRSNLLIRISGSTYMTPELDVHTFGSVETFIDEAHRTKVLAAFERARRGRRSPGKPSP